MCKSLRHICQRTQCPITPQQAFFPTYRISPHLALGLSPDAAPRIQPSSFLPSSLAVRQYHHTLSHVHCTLQFTLHFTSLITLSSPNKPGLRAQSTSSLKGPFSSRGPPKEGVSPSQQAFGNRGCILVLTTTTRVLRAFNVWSLRMPNILHNEFSCPKNQELRNTDNLSTYKYRWEMGLIGYIASP